MATQKLLPSTTANQDDMVDEEQLIEDERKIAQAISRALKTATNLSSLLPSGTLLIFHTFAPILSNGGHCQQGIEKTMTAGLLVCCGLLCFLLSFTDTYRNPADGKLYYGIPTLKGLWILHLKNGPKDTSQYRLTILDFFHALLTLIVFATSTLFTPTIKNCFGPLLPTAQLQNSVPMIVGFLICLIFIAFPSKRRGFDYPVEGFAALLAASEEES